MKLSSLFRPSKDKPRPRFYLLPGQSGRAYRRKQRTILYVSIVVGLLVAGIVALVMFLVYRGK